MNGSNENATLWNWLALLVSAVAVAGSLWLSIGMELVGCPLCFYQRTFVMCAFGVLLVGLLSGACRGAGLSLLTLPAAVGGLGVAVFHVFLEFKGTLECPKGILDIGSAPQQSLAAFVLLLIPLVLDVLRGPREAGAERPSPATALLAIVLGGLFAAGCILSAPKLPEPPKKAYDGPPKICRPPYVESR